ncbi:MAG: ATP-binding cassette domain-containing protein [Bacteroidales bacterium]
MVSYLQVEGISKAFGENILFKDISFSLHKDEKVALIAKNGTGKSTLLNIITGKDIADSGKISLRRELRISYLPQDPEFNLNNSILEQVLASSGSISEIIDEYHIALESGNTARIEKAGEQMDVNNAWDFDQKIIQVLSKLNLPEINRPIKNLSGGEKRRLALAAALVNPADLLILDEPTNHLDLQMIEWLEKYLKSLTGSLLMVTHDRYFMENVCNTIIEIENNKTFQYNGNYQYYVEKRAERLKEMQANIDKASNIYRKELDWMRRMPQARATKAKYRIENFYRIQEIASQKIDTAKQTIEIESKRLGKKILEIENLSKAFGEKTIIKNFTFNFSKSEKIGIVGPNGSGKSTFLNLITGVMAPDSGKIEKGETVHFGYYRQEGINLPEDMRMIDVIKEIADVVNLGQEKSMTAMQLLEYFRFPKEKHYSFVSKLSGGERKRLYLITVLMKSPNFLVLDEPTNDFDIQTLNVLEEYLNNFRGNVLIVSHDRYFMDKVVDQLFIFGENGNIQSFPGNYSDYQYDTELQEKEFQKQEKQLKPVVQPVAREKKKFGYKEKKEFEAIELEIQNLNNEKINIENLLNSGKLSNAELVENSNRYTQVLQLLNEKENRWIELSDLQLE